MVVQVALNHSGVGSTPTPGTKYPYKGFMRRRTEEYNIRHREYCKSHYARNRGYYKDKAIKYKDKARAFVAEYLKFHPCERCGESDVRVLDFDHLRDKVENVSTMAYTGCSSRALLEEIAKCQVLCANCHRITTWERRQPSSITGNALDSDSSD